MNKLDFHNRQKETRVERRKKAEGKGLKGLINPAIIYYGVVKPITDVIIAYCRENGIF